MSPVSPSATVTVTYSASLYAFNPFLRSSLFSSWARRHFPYPKISRYNRTVQRFKRYLYGTWNRHPYQLCTLCSIKNVHTLYFPVVSTNFDRFLQTLVHSILRQSATQQLLICPPRLHTSHTTLRNLHFVMITPSTKFTHYIVQTKKYSAFRIIIVLLSL